MDKGRVVVSPLEAEERPERVERLEDDITARLPLIDLPDLLIEVDQWTGFSHHLRHLNGREPHRLTFLPVLYTALLSQGCNFGFARMAQMADISADRLAWCTTWYLREDTLKAATDALVNFHHRLPLSQRWGGGTLSSSDGQRIPVAGKIRNATALRRYFLSQGLTFDSWTSDQFAQYLETRCGSKSGFAHSKTEHEGSISKGESEQKIPVITAQYIMYDMPDDEILGFWGKRPFIGKGFPHPTAHQDSQPLTPPALLPIQSQDSRRLNRIPSH